jgi:hypothetical protein
VLPYLMARARPASRKAWHHIQRLACSEACILSEKVTLRGLSYVHECKGSTIHRAVFPLLER